MEGQRPEGQNGDDLRFSSEAFDAAMALVKSGSDTNLTQGLAQLRVMSSQVDVPLIDMAAAATDADAMPVLLRVLDMYPPQSDAVKNVTWLFANLAVATAGCELLMAANAPVALGSLFNGVRSSLPAHIIDNSCWMLGNLARESFAMMKELVDNGSFHGILIPALDALFQGAPRNLSQLYTTVSWALQSFCSGEKGHIPYQVLRPALHYLEWGLQNLSGEALTSIGAALMHLFDGARPDVEWADLATPVLGLFDAVLDVLLDPTCLGANPAMFVRIVGEASSVQGLVHVFTPEVVNTLTSLLGYQVLQPSTTFSCLLWALSNLAAEPRCARTLLEDPGELPSVMKAASRRLPSLDPRSKTSLGVWKAMGELVNLATNLVTGSEGVNADAARSLLAWDAPALAAMILRVECPTYSLEGARAASVVKSKAARLATTLINQGSLEPDEAYSNGEEGPNAYFSQFVAAGRLEVKFVRFGPDRESSSELEFVQLATRLVGSHEALNVQVTEPFRSARVLQ